MRKLYNFVVATGNLEVKTYFNYFESSTNFEKDVYMLTIMSSSDL